MRFVDGTDLGEVLADEGRLDPGRAARILDQVSAALDAAHAGGLVHRDVKPANVLLEGEPGSEHAYLTDFGISKLVTAGTELTTTGRFVGTVDYVAPEQIAGEAVDGRADVYSLGVRRVPRAGRRTAVPARDPDSDDVCALERAAAAALRARFGGPPALDDVLAPGMAQKPDDRFESAGGLSTPARGARRDLGHGAAAPVRARDATASTRTLSAPWRHGALAWVAGGVVAAAAITARARAPARGRRRGGGGPRPRRALPRRSTSATRRRASRSAPGAVGRVHGRRRRRRDRPETTAPGARSWSAATRRRRGRVRVAMGGRPSRRRGHARPRRRRGLEGDRGWRKPSDVAVDGDWVWVANEGPTPSPGSIRARSGSRRSRSATVPRSLATGDGAVWVTNIEAPR